MADIRPLKALRYEQGKFPIPLVVPPYDIINEKQREDLASIEHNMINLDKPGKDDDPDRYKKAQSRLKDWKEKELLVSDDLLSIYVYSQRFKHLATGEMCERLGFFCRLKIEEHYENAIYPHEKTLSAPKADRLNLMRATQANLSPVFGLYKDDENAASAVFARAMETKPLYDVYVDPDGTEHRLWQVTDGQDIGLLEATLKGKDMVIADGHHRYETALNYAKEMRELHGDNEDARYNYILVCLVNFNDPGLFVLPTHRLLSGVTVTDEIMTELETYFDVTEKSVPEIEKILMNKTLDETLLGLYQGKDKAALLLSLKDMKQLDGIVPESPSEEWRSMEVNVLSYLIIAKIVKLSEEDFQKIFLFSHDFKETCEMVDNGEAGCAFLMPPSNNEEIQKVTKAHEVMPQKTTYFYPKIFSGFVIYDHTV